MDERPQRTKNELGESPDPDPVGDSVGVDPVEFVRRHRWLLLVGVLLGAAIAIALSYLVTPRWEANLVLRLGTMPQWSADTPTTVSIETPARATERINQASFKKLIVERIGLSANADDTRARIFLDSLRARPLDSSNLVSVQMRGPNRADAEALALGVANELAQTHARIAAPTLERFEGFLDETRADRRRTEEERDRLIESMTARSANVSGTSSNRENRGMFALRGMENAFSANVLTTQNNAVRELQKRESALHEVLSPERSYPTAPLEPVLVDEERVYPRRSVFAIVGAGIGLVLAAVAATLSRR